MQTFHLVSIRMNPPRLRITEQAWTDGTAYASLWLGPVAEYSLPDATTTAADEKLAELGWDRRNVWYAQSDPDQPYSAGVVRSVVDS